jgi:hypothetical protein
MWIYTCELCAFAARRLAMQNLISPQRLNLEQKIGSTTKLEILILTGVSRSLPLDVPTMVNAAR